jgi:hypothetical protein
MGYLEDKLFGPLGKDYCNMFYAISLVGLISMILIFTTTTYLMLFTKDKKTFGVKEGINAFVAFTIYLVIYFLSRLQNMCLGINDT